MKHIYYIINTALVLMALGGCATVISEGRAVRNMIPFFLISLPLLLLLFALFRATYRDRRELLKPLGIVWIIFGGVCTLVFLSAAADVVMEGWPNSFNMPLFLAVTGSAGGYLIASGVYYLRFPLPREGHCPMCGYDLRATPNHCPECGWQSEAEATNVSS